MRSVYELLLAVLLVVGRAYAAAADQNQARPLSSTRQSTQATLIGQAPISIAIQTTRQQPTAGDGLGVVAEISNVSTKIIYINEYYIVIFVPPELGGSSSQPGLYGTFPTEDHNSSRENRKYTIALKPGDKYKVVWKTEVSTGKTLRARVFDELWHFLFFPPGDYQISIVAKYWIAPGQPIFTWLDPTDPKHDPPDDYSYHVTSQDATIHVDAPQLIILLGAAIGGLFAFIVLPGVRSESFLIRGSGIAGSLKHAGRIIFGLLGAMMLGVVVTILLSRLSENQSMIRISISDFWGAIALGFIANYVGIRILSNILPAGEADDRQGKINKSPSEEESSDPGGARTKN
jgi:hypothetical protein